MIVDSGGGRLISAADPRKKVECSKISTLAATCRCVTQYFTFVQSDLPYQDVDASPRI